MKLASLKNGSRDGKLVVVSRDLTRSTDASFLVPTLQAALDDWPRISPHLLTLAESLETGAVPSDRFHEHDALSPLPRAYGRLTRSGGDDAFRWLASDAFLPPRDPLPISATGTSLRCALAAITGDIAAVPDTAVAAAAVRLLVLVASAAGEEGSAASLSPVAVTPDELAPLDSRDETVLILSLNGHPEATIAVPTNTAPTDLALAAGARALCAGTLVDGGGVTIEARSGDVFRCEMRDGGGHSIFGAIEQVAQAA